jgi:hypothetical protein
VNKLLIDQHNMRINTNYVEWVPAYIPSVPINARTLPRLCHHHFFQSKSTVNRHAHPPRGSCRGRHYCTIADLPGRLSKITERLSQNIRHPRRNSRRLPSEYTSEFLPLYSTCKSNAKKKKFPQKMLLNIPHF